MNRHWTMPSRSRTYLVGVVAAIVLVVGLAVALGGSGSTQHRAASIVSPARANGLGAGAGGSISGGDGATPPLPTGSSNSAAGSGSSEDFASGSTASVPGASPQTAPVQQALTSGASAGVAKTIDADNSSGSGAAATKIVKTGTIELSVPKGRVSATVTRLSSLASSEGGYVSTSRTNSGEFPSGSITLRIPVAKFGDALTAAASYGKVTNQSTHAQDVTGRYVDLNAQEHALEQTRSTYLTILAHATTIGDTLSVQQRIEDVQQQIDELHGEIKVLGSQSSYSTLTAYVSQPGTPAVPVRHHHERKGLAKAWHTSWSRFNRGIDAIVGAIGPIVLALLLLAVLALLIRLGYRAAERSEKDTTPSPTH